MSWKLAEQQRLLVEAEHHLMERRIASHRVALVYPNTYHVGMSSLGYQAVYRIVNEHPEFSCERGFLPNPEDRDEVRRTSMRLHSLETRTPFTNFDILAFSFSFEPDAFHVVEMLDLAGLPLRSRDRDERHPLVVMGGLVAQTNPEPLAPFADIFLLGDAEVMLPEFLTRFAHWRSGSTSRGDLYDRVRELPGVYIPGEWEPVRDEITGKLRAIHFLPGGTPPVIVPPRARSRETRPHSSVILTPNTEFRNMFLVEIGKGCPWKCNFCLVGHHVRPFKPNRYSLLGGIFDTIPERAVSVGLVSSAVADHKELKEIMRGVLDRGHRFSLPSVNLNRVDPETLTLIDEAGLKTLTVAPEAGSDRLRTIINKRILNETFLEFGRYIAQSRLATLKMYFLVGLPEETEEDVVAIAGLCKELHRVIQEAGGGRSRIRFTLSVNSFVPKPHTPYERLPMRDAGYLTHCMRVIGRELGRGGPFTLNEDNPRQSRIQALISLGDRRVADFLEATYREGGVKAGLKAWGGDVDWYIHREKDPEEVLPWSHLG